MKEKKFTKAEIVDAVYENTGLNRNDIRKVIDLSFNEIKKALLLQNIIELRGFGTFEIKVRKARQKARNPKTGQIISVQPHGIVYFRSGQELRQKAWNITDEDKDNN